MSFSLDIVVFLFLLIFSGVLPFIAVGATLSVAFYLVRRRHFLLAPCFVVGNLWSGWTVLNWVSAVTPSHGLGDYGPSIMGGLAGGGLSLAISAVTALALILVDKHRKRASQ